MSVSCFLAAPQGIAPCCGGLCRCSRCSSIASALLHLRIGLKSNFRHPPYPFPSGLGARGGQEDGPFHIRVEYSRPLFPSGRGRGRITHLIALITLLGVVLLALVESASGNRFATGE